MKDGKEVIKVLKENPPKTGLDYAMRVRGITNKSLAEEIGTEPQNVSNWRNGKLPLNKSIMRKIAQIIGENEYFLFFQEGNWEKENLRNVG